MPGLKLKEKPMFWAELIPGTICQILAGEVNEGQLVMKPCHLLQKMGVSAICLTTGTFYPEFKLKNKVIPPGTQMTLK